MIALKKFVVLGILCIIFVFFIKCSSSDQNNGNDPRGSAYAGSATCGSCHKNITGSYIHDSHYKSSAKANYDYLKKTIALPAHDTVQYIHNQAVVANKQNDDLYQTAYKGGNSTHSEKIDIAIGSAEKAQTYVYWKDEQLFELPLTYLTTTNSWTNSPGFPVDHPYYTRVIPSRCFECHASYVRTKEERMGSALQIKETMDRASIVYGIDCERCHGPAAQHVKFQQEHPDVKEAKFMTSIKKLGREQQLDMCGTCHAGDPVRLNSIFGFVPGDTLSKFYLYFNGSTGEPDVHGMQLQLLKLSKCFQGSQMTCNTCHSPHQAAGNALNTANTCVSCHQQVKHTTDITQANNDCISCHMPLRASKSLIFDNIEYKLRTHRIAIYK